jgi:predicted RNA-binding protein with TRAM domain
MRFTKRSTRRSRPVPVRPVEPLALRVLLAANHAAEAAPLTAPTLLAVDQFEPNDTLATATNFGALGDRSNSGLTIHDVGQNDYYRFTTPSAGVLNVRIDFTHVNGDLDMQLLDGSGNFLASSAGTSNTEIITRAVTPGQAFVVRVYGFNNAQNTYSMSHDGPDLPLDRFESNDSLAAARNLGAAGDRTFPDLNIHSGADNDYYRITTTGSGDLTVSLAFTHAFGDVDMQLLDAGGAVLGASSSTGNSESITRVGVAAGQVYIVRVYGFAGASNPDYDMTINGPDVFPDRFEANDTRATATNFGPLGDRTATGLSIHGSGNDDWYQFTAGNTGPLVASLAFTHALGDIDMQLTDAGGGVLASSSSITDAESINFPVTSGQTYYLRVYGFNGSINPNYTMTLNGPDLTPDYLEADDTLATARNLGAAGDRVFPDLNLHSGTDNDYYRLTTTGSGDLTVGITFTHAFGDVDMQLLDAGGGVLATSSSTGNSESITRPVAAAGEVYFVRVYGFAGMTNPDYDLTVNGPDIPADRFEPNDTRATATNFGPLGDRVANGLSIHAQGNDDWYQFTAGSTGTLNASLAFTHALGDIDMQLWDSGGAVLATSSSTTNAENISFAVTGGQTYFLRVYGFAGAINPNYGMSIDAPDLPPDRFEANDTLATARNLGAVGDRVFPDLNIHTANNNDYYRVATTGVGDLVVTANFTHALGDVDIQLLDSAGTVLATSSGTGNSESVTRTGVAAGQTYYVRVYGFAGATNPDYDMTINGPDIPPDRFEPNDTRATATDFGALGDRITNSLTVHASGNDDYYKFTAGSTGNALVSLAFTHALGDLDMQLLDGAGAVLGTSTSTTSAESITQAVTAGQVYYVRVYGFAGAINPFYTLTIDAPDLPQDRFEANDTLATARNLGAAGDRDFPDLNIHAANNEDFYRLTTVGSGNLVVSLSFTHAFGDVDLQLLDSAGNVLATSDGIGDAESVTRPVAAGEVYHVRVYGFSGNTNPDYDLTINGPDIAPDRFEANNTLATATNLGALGDRIENNLSIHQSNNDDYHRFTATSTGTVNVGLAFTHALGDVDLQLLDSGGAVLATSASTGSSETITRAVTAGQTYYVRVYGFNGAINPVYNLTIDGPAPAPAVAGRYVFYNHSALDGNNFAANSADDAAIASGKQALLPGGTAGFANLTSYSRGINGVMLDISSMPGGPGPTAADFVFRAGTGGSPGAWANAPAPASVTVRRGAGAGGSDRVTITWADNAIQNKWLQVTALANGVTGLANPDVFYFGNLVGEATGGAAPVVNIMDAQRTRLYAGSASAAALATCDFNRDGAVNAIDVLLARVNQSHSLAGFSAPAPVSASSSADAVSAAFSPARRTALRSVREELLG